MRQQWPTQNKSSKYSEIILNVVFLDCLLEENSNKTSV